MCHWVIQTNKVVFTDRGPGLDVFHQLRRSRLVQWRTVYQSLNILVDLLSRLHLHLGQLLAVSGCISRKVLEGPIMMRRRRRTLRSLRLGTLPVGRLFNLVSN